MKKTFINIIKKPQNIIFLIVTAIIIFVLLRFLPVYNILIDFYGISDISSTRRFEIFYQYIFEPFVNGTLQDKFSTITLSILTAFNILLFVIFTKRQRKAVSRKGFFATISGTFLGLFGVGCVSCGAFIVVPLLTFLGLTAYTNYFVQHAGLISNIGIILILVSVIYLLKQLSKPNICK